MAQPTSPSHPHGSSPWAEGSLAMGPSLSPCKRAERGKGTIWMKPSSQAGAAHARCLGGGRHLLDQMVDGCLDRAQERERVDPHPNYQDEQRNKQRLLARAQIEHAAEVGAG